MRLCYPHDVPVLTVRGKTACPACGVSYPFLPAVEPICSAPAQLLDGRGVLSSRPVSVEAFYHQNPAQDRGMTGGLSGAVKAAKPTAMAVKSSPELCRRSPITPIPRATGSTRGRRARQVHSPASRARQQNTGALR